MACFPCVVLIVLGFFAEQGFAQQAKIGKVWPYAGDTRLFQTPPGNVIALTPTIPYFNGQKDSIKIFPYGVVSFGENGSPPQDLPTCPNVNQATAYVAAFWLQTDMKKGGKVFYRREGAGATPKLNRSALVSEINSAIGQVGHLALIASHIVSIIVVTWVNVREPNHRFGRNSKNTFQLLLVSTSDSTFVQIVYEKLQYKVFVKDDGHCFSGATAAFNEPTSNIQPFELTNFFYLNPDNVIYYSNIPDFKHLGRYVMILKKNTFNALVQPAPPIERNCNDITLPSFICTHEIPKTYCHNRAVGVYPHPIRCQKFVWCADLKAYVLSCPNGVNFNPNFGNCDWDPYFHCTDAVAPKIVSTPAPFAEHENFCSGHGQDGAFALPGTCSKFVLCSNTRNIIFTCQVSSQGEQLHYNEVSEKCDYQANVTCHKNGVRPVFQKKVKPPQQSLPPQGRYIGGIWAGIGITQNDVALAKALCRQFVTGNVALPRQRHHFAQCVHARLAGIQRCPANLCFYQQGNKCDYCSKVVGQQPNTTTPNT